MSLAFPPKRGSTFIAGNLKKRFGEKTAHESSEKQVLFCVRERAVREIAVSYIHTTTPPYTFSVNENLSVSFGNRFSVSILGVAVEEAKSVPLVYYSLESCVFE